MSDFNKEEMGKRMAEIRKKNGKSQEQMAKKLGVKRNTISNYETGFTSPDCKFLYNFAKQNNVSIDYLITGEELGLKEPYLINLFNKLSSEDKDLFIRLLRRMTK